jgi:hypothetical protein
MPAGQLRLMPVGCTKKRELEEIEKVSEEK